MLGRLLELSIATQDILRSWEFYRALGFATVDGYEVYPYRYGVVTDGRIALGLHETQGPGLALTYVHPELARHARALREAGLVPTHERLSDEHLHELSLDAGDGVAVRLLEARTFSPAPKSARSGAGWFEELVLPARDVVAGAARWEQLGYVRIDGDDARATLTSDHLSLALLADSRGARAALRFAIDDARLARDALDALGLRCDGQLAARYGLPHALAVVAPEGTPLLLVPPGD